MKVLVKRFYRWMGWHYERRDEIVFSGQEFRECEFCGRQGILGWDDVFRVTKKGDGTCNTTQRGGR